MFCNNNILTHCRIYEWEIYGDIMGKSMPYVKDNNRRKPRKLLDLAREILRRTHYSIRTEELYVGWLFRCIYFLDTLRPYPCRVVDHF
jgi:hypothetical protein